MERPDLPDEPSILNMGVEITYRPTKAHEIRANNAEAHFQQHRDLVSPAHRKIRPAMKLHELVNSPEL